ncbi:LysR family transcriptional regulator, partial [Escherichia coli]|nr:LysR family transcriptional regulator [Escherichia coli]
MKPTDLNLIPIFTAIYEERNLSRAAARLNITQP